MQHEDADILISRVIDGRATLADWDCLDSQAATEAGIWKELAMAQRDHARLSLAVGRAVARAGTIEVPRTPAEIPATYSFARATMARRVRNVATWSGWAAAAVVGLAFLSRTTAPVLNTIPVQNADIGSGIGNAADALNLYLNKGREDGSVIGEQPDKQIVNVARVKDGPGYEVIYVRQILERARVDNLYRFTSDELGRPAPVPMQPQTGPAKKSRPKPAV